MCGVSIYNWKIVWWSLSNTKLSNHTHSIVCFHCDEWMAFWHWCSCFNQGNDFRYLLPDLDALEESLGCRLYRHWPICEAPWRQMTMPRTSHNYQILFSTIWVMSVSFLKMTKNKWKECLFQTSRYSNLCNLCVHPLQLPPWKPARWKISYACNQIWIIFLTGRFGRPTCPGSLKECEQAPLQIGVGTAVHPKPKNQCGCIRKVMI